jgi:enoyl-CoA hydratase/carnithine racemase
VTDRVRIERDGGIARVMLARPDKHNGVDLRMVEAVRGAARELRRDESLRAVILAGDGPSFCAGLDIKSVFGQRSAMLTAVAALVSPLRNRFQDWSMAWRELPVPVIAAIHGTCFGAGLQLALGADIRIATPDAQLSLMEARWGLVPDMGGPTLLAELLRMDVAKELTFTGRILSGVDAADLGLVTHLDADPQARAAILAAEIATRSPDAVAADKFLLQQSRRGGEYRALAAERRWQRRIIGRGNQRVAVARQTGRPDEPWQPRRIR